MNKEQWYIAVILIGLILFVIISGIVGLFFGEVYLIILLFMLVSGSVLFFIVLYLRIQHNLDNKGRNINGLRKFIDSKLNQKFNEQKKIYKEIADFFESLLKFLEDSKRKDEEGLKNLKETIGDVDEDIENLTKELGEKFNEQKEIQKRMAGGVENMFDSQYEQVEKVESDLRKEFEDFKKEIKEIVGKKSSRRKRR